MKFEIQFTTTAANQIRSYHKFAQKMILSTISEQLLYQPMTETRNRKQLGENQLSDWELRIDNYRVFYDVLIEKDHRCVQIKAVGHKEHNVLYIGGKQVQL